ncbi:HigA family addiction module antitoxin [Pyruvatibacter mobilis]|jgi:antitoxin HigA-1|uniref:HigA family addiction module antitoxin n=1 Tax=Pyruvatibacter mobilis TaxID=1712261 RepID=UPI003BAD5A32
MARTPMHPGEMLKEGFLDELGLSATSLARHIGVPANRLTSIIAGKRGITGETAILLGKALGTTPEFWLNLQKTYELDVAATSDAAKKARSIRPVAPAA